jgi:putative transposase
MLPLYHRLVAIFATATRQQLARTIQYYRNEARTYRELCPKHYRLTPKQRQRILKYGRPLGAGIKDVVTIVTPRTFARWASGETKSVGKQAVPSGRPKTAAEIRDLIVRIAQETGWGLTRILGELKKLGLAKVCRTTVANILRDHGFDTGPKRGEGTWDEFLKMHAETLWQCDFFSKNVWTPKGLVPYFMLVFLHVGSRRVFASSPTAQPDSAWVTQQARNFVMHLDETEPKPAIVICDHDSKFTATFDTVLESEGMKVQRVGPMAPNLNAFVERWIQSIKHECLDRFIVFGQRHLAHLVREYVRYYHEHRPHQALGNEPLTPTDSPAPSEGQILCDERLGGVLKHYYRRAA